VTLAAAFPIGTRQVYESKGENRKRRQTEQKRMKNNKALFQEKLGNLL